MRFAGEKNSLYFLKQYFSIYINVIISIKLYVFLFSVWSYISMH